MKVCYCINFKLWMNYCACWHCDDMVFWLLITIPISVYLHRTNIFCFDNQLSSSYNLYINCCVFHKCICTWCEHYNIKSIGRCVCCVYGYILPDSTNDAILSLIPSRTTWWISSTVSEEVDFDDNRIPQLEVNAITDSHVIPTSVCYRTQANKAISRQSICLTDAE